MSKGTTSAEEWALRMEAWRQSGESIQSFALRKGFNYGTFKWWIGKLRRSPDAAKRADRQPVAGNSFVPVVTRAAEMPSSNHSVLDVVIHNGITLRVPQGADLKFVRSVIASLGDL